MYQWLAENKGDGKSVDRKIAIILLVVVGDERSWQWQSREDWTFVVLVLNHQSGEPKISSSTLVALTPQNK